MTTNNEAMLTVGPSPDLPRRLWISVSSMSIGVALYLEDTHRRVLFAYALRPDTALRASERIELDLSKSLLWIGRTQFELSPEEALQVREYFEPLGLAVKSASPSPVAPSFETAHEAAQPLPLGERGTLPATVFEAEPAELELDNATAARALTANECF